MRHLFKFLWWFWSGAYPPRQWRYFVRGQRRAEHAHLRTFRLRFAPFALSQAVMGLPWAGAALVGPSSARMFLLGLGALKVVGGGALAGAFVARFLPVRANKTELRGRTFIGLSRRVRWEDIETARIQRWLFTPYLLISSRGERSLLWLPLFLCQQHDFERQLEGWLTPEHPLRRCLDEARPPGIVAANDEARSASGMTLTSSRSETPSCPTS